MTDSQLQELLTALLQMQAQAHSDMDVVLHWIAGVVVVQLVCVFALVVLILRGGK